MPRSLLWITPLMGCLLTLVPAQVHPAPPDPLPRHLQERQWVYTQLRDASHQKPWPVAFYITAHQDRRYQGLLLRCREPGSVEVSFAFGRIMDTDRRANIEIYYGFDNSGSRQEVLITRNHTNAIMQGGGVMKFLLQLTRRESLSVRSRSWPHGWVNFTVPLSSGRTAVRKLLHQCTLSEQTLAQITQPPARSKPRNRLDRLLQRFWRAADDPVVRMQLARRIAALKPDFSTLTQKLRQGPKRSDANTEDRIETYREAKGRQRAYFLKIPADYDPHNPTPVFIFLHGGVHRPRWKQGQRWWPEHPTLAPRGFIGVYPNAWKQSYWWQEDQVENLHRILGLLRRDYHIDDNRIYLAGASDGGTGVYYFALRHSTPFAGFLIFLSIPDVLLSPALGVEGSLFLPNLRNKPLLLINGAKDPLFPTPRLKQFLKEYRQMGVDFTSYIIDSSAHDMNWLGSERPQINAFLEQTRRNPLPDQLFWQAEDTAPGKRIHWLVIEKTRPNSNNTPLDSGGGQSPASYADAPWVEAKAANNVIKLQSDGVARVRLLISPDRFDFSQPLTVEYRGKSTTYPPLAPSVEILLKWYLKDDDPSMLFGRELVLKLPPSPS